MSRFGDSSMRGSGAQHLTFRGRPLRLNEVLKCRTSGDLRNLMAAVDRVRGAKELGNSLPLEALGRTKRITIGGQHYEIVVVTTPRLDRLVVNGLESLIGRQIKPANKYRAHDYLQVNPSEAQKIEYYLNHEEQLRLGLSMPSATEDALHRIIRTMLYSADFWTDSAGTPTQFSMLLTGGRGTTFFTKGGNKDLDPELTDEMRKALLVLVRKS